MKGRPTNEPYTVAPDGKHYVTPVYYELVYGRNHRTVRDWARTGKVRSMWHNDTLYVHLKSCQKIDADTPKQERTTKQEAS